MRMPDYRSFTPVFIISLLFGLGLGILSFTPFLLHDSPTVDGTGKVLESLLWIGIPLLVGILIARKPERRLMLIGVLAGLATILIGSLTIFIMMFIMVICTFAGSNSSGGGDILVALRLSMGIVSILPITLASGSVSGALGSLIGRLLFPIIQRSGPSSPGFPPSA